MNRARADLITVGMAFASLLLVLNVAGCANNGTGARVVALANRDVAALTADDIACVMRRAGFSDAQVIDLGTDLRNSLASTGAAKIIIGDKVEAILALDGDYLHAASRRRGSFIYELKTRRFR
jgi:hypothetical protein